MNLNCLKGGLKRTDSDIEVRDTRLCQEKANIARFLSRVERSLSGNLAAPPRVAYGKMRTGSNLMADKKDKEEEDRYRTSHSAPLKFDDTASPRLVRSSGMRRDWSFENLRRGLQGY